MKQYECGRIRVLAQKLSEAGVPKGIADDILKGGDRIATKTAGEKKADWMRVAMRKMDTLLTPKVRHAIREGCACCLGGKRLALSKGIAKKCDSLEDRIKAANETRFVFGHSVTREDDGKIVVRFAPDGQESYRCVCLSKAKEPLSITYCYCCGGHIKHHLQTALGRKLSCKVKSSPLSSGGKKPCTFVFTLDD